MNWWLGFKFRWVMRWWRFTYALPLDHDRAHRWRLYRWFVRKRWWPQFDFKCRVCGASCDTAPNWPFRAVCQEHCLDHNYEYDRSMGGRFCTHCGDPMPYDLRGD